MGIVSIAFAVYLAKGHLDWIPDFAPLLVMMLAGVYWFAVDGNARSLAAAIFPKIESPILHPETEKPITRSKASVTKAGGALAVSVIFILIGIVCWGFRSDASSRQIHIRNIEIGVADSDEHFIVPETKNIAPETKWTAYVRYNSPSLREAFVSYTGVVLHDLPTDLNERNKDEDMIWDGATALLKYNKTPMQIQANTPLYTTFTGPFVSEQDLCDIINHKAAVYFVAVFSYRNLFSQHQVEICTYREGNAPALHYCHAHNTP